jgi:hypothetical protein
MEKKNAATLKIIVSVLQAFLASLSKFEQV